MSDWATEHLVNVVTLQRGHDLPATQRGNGTVPVIGSFGITGYHDVARYEGPGVAIGRSGASIGVATYCVDDYWPLNTCLFATDFHGNDPRWVYYLLDSIDFSGYNSGSAQPSLNRNYLARIPVLLPPVPEQRGIATTLGALDDKIESNRRAISLTQELSRHIFEQWREHHAPLTETTFGEFTDVFGGATPRTTEEAYWGGRIAWSTPTDITSLKAPYLYATARTISEQGLASTSGSLHPPGTILMTSRATIGAFAVAQLPTATNQGFIAVRPRKSEHRWFLFEEMRARVPDMLELANGSTFMEISRGNFKRMRVAVPDDTALGALDAELSPLHARAAQLDMECARLTDIRHVLMPELLSGCVRVSEAPELAGEAVA